MGFKSLLMLVLLMQITKSLQTENSTEPSSAQTTTSPATPKQNVPIQVKPPSLPPHILALAASIRVSESEYGHVEVRDGAFLFWWLYFADGLKEAAHTKPLIIWIQGGPSIPGSGLGNFVEIGPLTLSLKKRTNTWVKGKNILFVDSPVGTGYSYTTSKDLYCKSDKDIAADLIQLVKAVLDKYPPFKTTPVHIFSQSYGTKIASYFAYYLAKDIEKGEVEMNLKTVALGGSWVSPKETTLAAPEFLYQTGFLDMMEYQNARNKTSKLASMIDRKEFREGFKYRLEILDDIYPTIKSINTYNIFKGQDNKVMEQLSFLMNSLVPHALGGAVVGRSWEFYNQDIVLSLQDDFIKPCTHVVENILKETNLRVVVYNGDLDSVTPMAGNVSIHRSPKRYCQVCEHISDPLPKCHRPGAVNWVHNLEWHGKDKFWSTKKRQLNGQSNGFFKEHDRLSLWWILRAGHWVPTDNPVAMDQLLQYVVHENKDLFPMTKEETDAAMADQPSTLPTTTTGAELPPQKS